MKEKLIDIGIEYFRNNFPSWVSLFVGNSLIVLGVWNFSEVPYDLKVLLSLFLCFIYSIIWGKCRFLFPRNVHHKRKMGIVFAIEVENNLQKNRLKNDFLNEFNNLLSKNKLKSIVEVVSLNNFQSKKVKPILDNCRDAEISGKQDFRTKKDFMKLNKEMKCSFFIWGNIKEREAGNSSYVFDINPLVVHRPVEDGGKQQLKEVFMNSWYNRILFKKSWELFGFELSANMVFESALYALGIAALISRDPFLALKLHKQLLEALDSSVKKMPKFMKVKKEVEQIVSEENFLIAQVCYFENKIDEANNYLKEAFKVGRNHYTQYLFESIMKFEAGDIDGALESVEKAKKHSTNFTWKYNKAFLLMGKGNYKGAWSIYRKLGNSTFSGENITLEQIILYIKRYLEENPDMIQFHFVLAFLYYKKYKRFKLAIKEFDLFISKVENSKMDFLEKLAGIYLKKIEKLNSKSASQ